jgi:hypothetical protein
MYIDSVCISKLSLFAKDLFINIQVHWNKVDILADIYIQLVLLYHMHTATKIPFMCSFGNCVASPNFHIHVSVTDFYIPKMGPHIFLQQNTQISCGII